jgi:hypothetical protein
VDNQFLIWARSALAIGLHRDRRQFESWKEADAFRIAKGGKYEPGPFAVTPRKLPQTQ